MTSRDIRDILSLPQRTQDNAIAGPSSATTIPTPTVPNFLLNRQQQQTKSNKSSSRPDGISRELQALIGDSAPSLAQVRAELAGAAGVGGVKYRDRISAGAGKGKKVKWEIQPFKPTNHPSPSLRLSHWKQIVEGQRQDVEPEDPFSVFGKDSVGPNVMEYSQHEYNAHLGDPDWTAEETAYLFTLLKSYDLRFFIVADRYAYVPPGKESGQTNYPYPIIPPSGQQNSSGGDKGGTGGSGGQNLPTSAGVTRRSTRAGIVTEKVASSTGRGSRTGTPASALGADNLTPAPESSTAGGGVGSSSGVKVRTIEEIKNRYYTICRRLIRHRPSADNAVQERLLHAYAFDMDREIARKKYASSLLNLTRPQILEEQSLYVELQKIQQTQARYASEREQLMKQMGGLESGLFYPDGVEGNKVFGNAAADGIGGSRGADGVLMSNDKTRKRKRNEDGEVQVQVEAQPMQPTGGKRKKEDPLFDEKNNIYRVPQPKDSGRHINVPAYLRSTKLPIPKVGSGSTAASAAARVEAVVTDLGINPKKLIMPTRTNLEKLDSLFGAALGMMDMKRLVDRAEQEVRSLRNQKEMSQVFTPVASGSVEPVLAAVRKQGRSSMTPAASDASGPK